AESGAAQVGSVVDSVGVGVTVVGVAAGAGEADASTAMPVAKPTNATPLATAVTRRARHAGCGRLPPRRAGLVAMSGRGCRRGCRRGASVSVVVLASPVTARRHLAVHHCSDVVGDRGDLLICVSLGDVGTLHSIGELALLGGDER